MIKSRKIIGLEYAACTGEFRNAYKILSYDLKGRFRCRLEYNIKRYMIGDCGWALSGSG
jgi:hypothetical protein